MIDCIQVSCNYSYYFNKLQDYFVSEINVIDSRKHVLNQLFTLTFKYVVCFDKMPGR